MNVNRGTIHPFLFSRRREANQQGLHARKRYALNFCCVARGHHQHTNASLMQVGWDELLSLRRSPDGRTKWAFDESQPRAAPGKSGGAASSSIESAAPVWEPLENFDEESFLKLYWPGWDFDKAHVEAFKRQVQQFNRRMGRKLAEAYQGGCRLKIRTPPFLIFERDWERNRVGEMVDLRALRSLVADLRANHDAILREYAAVPDARLSDASTHMLTNDKLWVEAMPSYMPRFKALMEKHVHCISEMSISILKPGACSKVHTGQFNMRLRLHYPLIIPSSGPELAGAYESHGNVWSRGEALIIDDAQLHAVRNTGKEKRCIVLCDLRRTDLPILTPEMMAGLG
jgi:hypothetical protein